MGKRISEADALAAAKHIDNICGSMVTEFSSSGLFALLQEL